MTMPARIWRILYTISWSSEGEFSHNGQTPHSWRISKTKVSRRWAGFMPVASTRLHALSMRFFSFLLVLNDPSHMTGHYDFNGQPHFWKWDWSPISSFANQSRNGNREEAKWTGYPHAWFHVVFARYTRHTRIPRGPHVNKGIVDFGRHNTKLRWVNGF